MSFFAELKRRNVPRAGLAYLAAVWVLIQVADTLLPVVDAPAWALQALVVAGALGFPLTVALAWSYEWTAEGVKATSDVAVVEPVGVTGRKIDFLIIGLLVVAIAFLAVGRLDAVDPSIAVLPFSNESAASQENIDFAIGIHNETLTQLGKIGSLTVIGRSSVMEYRDSPKNARAIGRELGVATLLSGQVQRVADRVRVNIQLVDTENDRQLWTESYERELTAANIFAIQAEIAADVVAQLNATLTAEEAAALQTVPTRNEEARLHYERGLYYVDVADDEPVDLPLAIEQFERALDLDSEFALAWADLGRVHSQMYNLGIDPSEARLVRAREALDRASELAPDAPEVHLALSGYYAASGDSERALEEIETALEGMPNNPEIHQIRALRYRRMGRWDEAREASRKAAELDPRNHIGGGGWLDAWLRDYAGFQEYLDANLQFSPNEPVTFAENALLPLWRDGDPTLARAAATNFQVPFGSERMRIGWIAALYERDYERALAYCDDMELLYGGDRRYIPKDSYFGVTHVVFGRPELAEPYFERARAQVENAMNEIPDDPRLHVTLAEALVGLGDSSRALDEAQRALALMPRSRDAIAGSRIQRDVIVRVLAPAGAVDELIEQLDDYLAYPGLWSLEGMLPDPRFDAVRDDPELRQFVASRSQ